MARAKPKQANLTLRDHIRRERSGLFVASGPSRQLVRDYLPHFGVVAAFQQAALDVPGPIDYGFFHDWEMSELARPAFPRIRHFVAPSCGSPGYGLMSELNVNDLRSFAQCGIPEDRLITFTRHIHAGDRATAYEVIGEFPAHGDKGIFLSSGSPAAIQILAMLGMRWILCLGCSDLEGEVDAPHISQRKACENAADALAECYGCRVVFWQPTHTPENWREECDRGYRVTR